MEPEPRHQRLIYEGSPSQKLPFLAGIIQRKLEEGFRCLYLNSAPMVAGMGSTLAGMGLDVAKEIANGRLILSSDPVTTNEFDGPALLIKLERSLDDALNDGYKGLWASGDMTWEFGPRKDFSRLMEYEIGLEQIFERRKELCGVCQYHRESLPHDVMRQSLLIHPGIVINETIGRVNPHYLKSALPVDQITALKLDEMLAEIIRVGKV